MIEFLIAFVFSATLESASEVRSSHQQTIGGFRESLQMCFGSKIKLLDVCFSSVSIGRLRDLFTTWKNITVRYAATDCSTLSMGYALSTKYEFFYVLCCLPADKIQNFLIKFQEFYDTVLDEKKTDASASFLMLCAALEDDPIEALKRVYTVIISCEFSDPTIFVAQFKRENHGLPHAFDLMWSEDDEQFMIAHLQANSARSDQPE